MEGRCFAAPGGEGRGDVEGRCFAEPGGGDTERFLNAWKNGYRIVG